MPPSSLPSVLLPLTDELETDADDLPLSVADDGHQVESRNFTHCVISGVWLKEKYLLFRKYLEFGSKYDRK